MRLTPSNHGERRAVIVLLAGLAIPMLLDVVHAATPIMVDAGRDVARVSDAVGVRADARSAAVNANVLFSAADLADAAAAVEIFWDFGDGTVAFGEQASHAFAAAGTYEARVTLTTASGEVFGRTLVVTVAE